MSRNSVMNRIRMFEQKTPTSEAGSAAMSSLSDKRNFRTGYPRRVPSPKHAVTSNDSQPVSKPKTERPSITSRYQSAIPASSSTSPQNEDDEVDWPSPEDGIPAPSEKRSNTSAWKHQLRSTGTREVLVARSVSAVSDVSTPVHSNHVKDSGDSRTSQDENKAPTTTSVPVQWPQPNESRHQEKLNSSPAQRRDTGGALEKSPKASPDSTVSPAESSLLRENESDSVGWPSPEDFSSLEAAPSPRGGQLSLKNSFGTKASYLSKTASSDSKLPGSSTDSVPKKQITTDSGLVGWPSPEDSHLASFDHEDKQKPFENSDKPKPSKAEEEKEVAATSSRGKKIAQFRSKRSLHAAPGPARNDLQSNLKRNLNDAAIVMHEERASSIGSVSSSQRSTLSSDELSTVAKRALRLVKEDKPREESVSTKSRRGNRNLRALKDVRSTAKRTSNTSSPPTYVTADDALTVNSLVTAESDHDSLPSKDHSTDTKQAPEVNKAPAQSSQPKPSSLAMQQVRRSRLASARQRARSASPAVTRSKDADDDSTRSRDQGKQPQSMAPRHPYKRAAMLSSTKTRPAPRSASPCPSAGSSEETDEVSVRSASTARSFQSRRRALSAAQRRLHRTQQRAPSAGTSPRTALSVLKSKEKMPEAPVGVKAASGIVRKTSEDSDGSAQKGAAFQTSLKSKMVKGSAYHAKVPAASLSTPPVAAVPESRPTMIDKPSKAKKATPVASDITKDNADMSEEEVAAPKSLRHMSHDSGSTTNNQRLQMSGSAELATEIDQVSPAKQERPKSPSLGNNMADHLAWTRVSRQTAPSPRKSTFIQTNHSRTPTKEKMDNDSKEKSDSANRTEKNHHRIPLAATKTAATSDSFVDDMFGVSQWPEQSDFADFTQATNLEMLPSGDNNISKPEPNTGGNSATSESASPKSPNSRRSGGMKSSLVDNTLNNQGGDVESGNDEFGVMSWPETSSNSFTVESRDTSLRPEATKERHTHTTESAAVSRKSLEHSDLRKPASERTFGTGGDSKALRADKSSNKMTRKGCEAASGFDELDIATWPELPQNSFSSEDKGQCSSNGKMKSSTSREIKMSRDKVSSSLVKSPVHSDQPNFPLERASDEKSQTSGGGVAQLKEFFESKSFEQKWNSPGKQLSPFSSDVSSGESLFPVQHEEPNVGKQIHIPSSSDDSSQNNRDRMVDPPTVLGQQFVDSDAEFTEFSIPAFKPEAVNATRQLRDTNRLPGKPNATKDSSSSSGDFLEATKELYSEDDEDVFSGITSSAASVPRLRTDVDATCKSLREQGGGDIARQSSPNTISPPPSPPLKSDENEATGFGAYLDGAQVHTVNSDITSSVLDPGGESPKETTRGFGAGYDRTLEKQVSQEDSRLDYVVEEDEAWVEPVDEEKKTTLLHPSMSEDSLFDGAVSAAKNEDDHTCSAERPKEPSCSEERVKNSALVKFGISMMQNFTAGLCRPPGKNPDDLVLFEDEECASSDGSYHDRCPVTSPREVAEAQAMEGTAKDESSSDFHGETSQQTTKTQPAKDASPALEHIGSTTNSFNELPSSPFDDSSRSTIDPVPILSKANKDPAKTPDKLSSSGSPNIKSPSQSNPLTLTQRRILEKFSSTLKNSGMEVLKLNRDKKWQLRFLTVSREVSWLNEGESNNRSGNRGQCPRGLLWVKRFNAQQGYSIESTERSGRGGMMLTDLKNVAASKRFDSAYPVNRKFSAKFKDSVVVRLQCYEREGDVKFVTLRCKTTDEAHFLCTGLRVILDVLKREGVLRDSKNTTSLATPKDEMLSAIHYEV